MAVSSLILSLFLQQNSPEERAVNRNGDHNPDDKNPGKGIETEVTAQPSHQNTRFNNVRCSHGYCTTHAMIYSLSAKLDSKEEQPSSEIKPPPSEGEGHPPSTEQKIELPTSEGQNMMMTETMKSTVPHHANTNVISGKQPKKNPKGIVQASSV